MFAQRDEKRNARETERAARETERTAREAERSRQLNERKARDERRLDAARNRFEQLARDSVLAAAPSLTKRGWIRNPRDLHRLHAELIAANRALPLGRPFAVPPPPPADETGLAVARVRALFER